MTRFFDLFFSSLALFVFSPLLILIILILSFTGEKKIFFFQERFGKGGRNFKIIKFVTMLENSPNIGTGTVTVKNDKRILPFGKFLRKTKINELPQLFNVLKGDMSLIGPRPLTYQTFKIYSDSVKKEITKIRPGLSGVGSIIFRNEEEIINNNCDPIKFYRDIISPYKGELEKWYIKNCNLRNYFLLIFITIFVVILPSNNFIWILLKDLPSPPSTISNFLYKKKTS